MIDSCRDPSVLDECGLDEKTKDMLLDNIKQKLMSQAVKIRSDVEVSCYAYEGIEAVKKALRAGLECSMNDMPVKINLIAPPLYGKTISIFFIKVPNYKCLMIFMFLLSCNNIYS